MIVTLLQPGTLFLRWQRLVATLLSLTAVTAVSAADVSPLVSGPELGLPSIWRVLFGFVLVAAAAVGAALLLRRLKPWVPLAGESSGAEVLLLSHRQLARNLHVHVIETQQQRFMVVSSQQQLVVTALNKSTSSELIPAPQE